MVSRGSAILFQYEKPGLRPPSEFRPQQQMKGRIRPNDGFRGVKIIIRTCVLLVFIAHCSVAFGGLEPGRRSVAKLEEERASDAPAFIWRSGSSPRHVSTYNNFTSYQVNVDSDGNNITGDAANEPSITVNPLNPGRMSIGWRQFNSALSNFRQGGWAYTTNGGTSWTFPGTLDTGFRSDPVLQSDAAGNFFYLSLVPNFLDDLWFSANGGQSYAFIGPALGGDKQWFTIDNTNGPGRGYLYQSWSSLGNNFNGQFTRSLDSGATWMDPVAIPNSPSDGTLDVDSSGNVYIGGVNFDDGATFWCVRSSNAKDPAVTPTFDQIAAVDLGGRFGGTGSGINPAGLVGQVYLAVDRSGTITSNNVYLLASVFRTGLQSNADVMFVRSTDGGVNFDPPRQINDDPANPRKWHWFGTLAVAPNGRIDVVWFDTRNAANNTDSQLFYSYSLDGGQSWSANVAVSEPFNPFLGYPNQQKMGDYISMVSDSTGASVAYCATFNLEQDIYYVRVGPPAASPVFAVRSITRDTNGATIIFSSEPNKTYRCDYSDMPGGAWHQLQTGIQGTGGNVSVFDPAAADTLTRFYRIVVLP